MNFRLPTFVTGAVAASLLGAATFAAASSVDNRPAPKIVIPNSPISPSSAGQRVQLSAERATHDVNDDKGGAATRAPASTAPATRAPAPASRASASRAPASRTPGTGVRHSDDPATHDVNDDRGGAASRPSATRAPATHAPTATAATRAPGTDDPATHDVNDDSGSGSGSGR
ncbi:MAG: hypothetical protein QOG49_922 [Frankiaceae bacterium]|nr:hypothetical protein [Frankiaceae bacterium]